MVCVLCLFRWLCCVIEFVCLCMCYIAYFISLCMYLLWFHGVLGYFVLFFIMLVFLFMIVTLSVLNWSLRWMKSCFCLTGISPKPYWSVTYFTWSGSCPFCRAWVAFNDNGHVCGCVLTSNAIWFVITCNMCEVSFLALLGGINMITFLLPVIIWCITIIFPSSDIVCFTCQSVHCTWCQWSDVYVLHGYVL